MGERLLRRRRLNERALEQGAIEGAQPQAACLERRKPFVRRLRRGEPKKKRRNGEQGTLALQTFAH